MANVEEFDSRLLGLPTPERARLARLLLISLEEQVDEDVDEAWRLEAERRYREYQEGKTEAIAADDAIREARQNLR